MSLRQGDIPSMQFFAFAIDLLLIYLDKHLKGIKIYESATEGPFESDNTPPKAVFETYKVIGYTNDAKTMVTSMD